MKHLKTTISQIAKICNVSQGTVDRALNGRPDIKAETKQKILEIANTAVDILMNNEKESVIIEHFIKRHTA